MEIQDKRKFIYDRIASFFKEKGFKKSANNFYMWNGEIAYCANIQNDIRNSPTCIKFTLNLGIFTSECWYKNYNLKNNGLIPKVPKEYECAVRARIGVLLPAHTDNWYSIDKNTNVIDLWNVIKDVLTEYAIPFLWRYKTSTDIDSNHCKIPCIL